MVAVRGRWLGHIDRVRAWEGLLQPLFQGLIKSSLLSAFAWLMDGLGMTIRSGHVTSSRQGFREPDLAEVPTMLDDDSDKKFKKGPERP